MRATDKQAMDVIHAILDEYGEEWDSSTIERVAAVIEATGRIIRDPNDETPDNVVRLDDYR